MQPEAHRHVAGYAAHGEVHRAEVVVQAGEATARFSLSADVILCILASIAGPLVRRKGVSMHESDYDQSPLLAELYDHVVPYQDRPDIPFYVRAALDAQGPVLELGCGTGRTMLPIARAGATISGLDSSRWMLERCRARAASEPPDVRARIDLHAGDMRDFDLGRTFALITIPFRAFQHLITVDDQVACLRSIYRSLTSGGRLILDLFNPSIPRLALDPADTHFDPEPAFTLPDGREVARHARVLRATRSIRSRRWSSGTKSAM